MSSSPNSRPESGGGDGSEDEPPQDGPATGGRSTSAGFRVALYFLTVFMAISLSLTFLLNALEGPEAVQELAESAELAIEPVLFLWLRLSTLPLVLLVTVVFVRRVDRRSFASVGLDVPAGSGLHAVLACLLATTPLALWLLLIDPWVDSELAAWSPEALIADPWLPLGTEGFLQLTAAFLGIAFLDELIFRGYVYSAFRDRFSWVHAAGLANLLAIALQAGHPEIGAFGLINTFLLGLGLAAMREKTGSLLMSTVFLGLWRALLACGLSLPVWGTLYPRLYDHQLTGPETLTGGPFGPIGSWLLTLLLLPMVAALAWWVEKDSGAEPKQSANRDSS